MKMIVKLLTSTAFMMGLAVVVSLLTNQFVTGVYPDFLAKDSGLRSNSDWWWHPRSLLSHTSS